jgi:hypothetical protein
MAANTAPIFSRTPAMGWGTITAANTAKDGTGTVVTIFTADAVEGSYVEGIKLKPLGTNVASVLRVFINNGLTNATAANNILFADQGLLATTNTEVAGQTEYFIPVRTGLPAGYRLNITLGTAVAAGWAATVVGAGNY